ncbi:hypothetical protein GPA10_04855 [Streptomyces sp. p1417]|uniref:Uncharacterized protein n=1 Tax=Streptomyces typhae TaxID=2681492 RepID=A0A6L6WPE8_9ACTN|nr:hypothetical protein [Streptomyces typhae]MVO84115.1 hypothetical protein [Streptomyces typhae]
MTVLVVALIVVLIALGFSQPVLWLAAAALVWFLVRRFDGGQARPGSSGSGAGATAPGPSAAKPGGALPSSYRDYRIRRDRQERWDRRYRRTHPKAKGGK